MNTIIIEETEHGDYPIDIYTKLSRDRILFLYDYIDDKLATDIVATLLLKDSEFNEGGSDEDNKISIFINAEGGDIRNVFMIYDVIKMLQSPIETVCVGSAMDEVTLLLAAGTPGRRFATQNAVVCPSQLMADRSFYANLTDAKGIMERFSRDNKDFMTALAKCSNKPFKQVMEDFERKKFMTAKQAVAYGIIDGVVGK